MKTIFNTIYMSVNSHFKSSVRSAQGLLHSIGVVTLFLLIGSGSAWGEYSTAPAGTYNLVTDASTLTAGDIIIIAGTNASTTKAISTTQNNNNRASVEVTLSSSSITLAANNTVQGLTLEAGTKSGTFSFNTGGGYLYAASSSSNYLKTEAQKSANSSWTISISNGLATITAQGSNTRCLMKYNHSNNPPLFSCYATNATTGVLVNIYKKAASGYTVNFAVNPAGYGTVSPSAQLTGVASGTAITKGTGANVNKVTVGSTTVTATPTTQTAQYTYAFSSWSVTDNLTSVTKNVTVTANFTRTDRKMTNYRTSCCDIEAATGLSASVLSGTSVRLTWTAPSPATGISILQVVDGNGTVKVDNLSANATTADVTGLTECETYTFKIKSVGSGSCDTYSTTVDVQPFSGAKTVTYKYHDDVTPDGSFTTDCSHTSTNLPNPSRTGYTLNGWYTDASGGTKKGDGGASYTPDADITLHAQWSQTNYTVTMQQSPAAGATLTGGTTTAHYGGTINISTDVPSGYRFNGWTASPSVTFANASATTTSFTMPAGNVTVTANFAQTHAVSFSVPTGGGTVVSPPSTIDHGGTLTFPNVTDVDCGTFLGWTDYAHRNYNETSGKPSPCYNAGSTIVLNANTQFYAVYSKVSDDAVSGVLYHHADDGTDLSDNDHTGVTATGSGLGAYSSGSYYLKFDNAGDNIIFKLDGTPTSFAAAFKTASNGTVGFSGFTLYESDETSGPWTQIGDEVGASSTSTSFSLNITTAASFSKRVLKLEMTHKSLNVGCGEITINGLRAPIYYTTNPGCVDWVLDAINVTTAPTKTTYDECEEFDPSGMAVTATMKENGNPSNTTTKDVAGYIWIPTQFLTPGNSIPVTFSYTEKGVTKTTTTNVKVTDLPNYTITFHDGDNTFTWTQSNHCDACDLDSRTGSLACGDYTFAGWSTSSTSYDDQSATITTWVSGSYTPTANTHLYAIYRKGAAPPDFTLNCDGGTFYIYEANGNTHMAGRVNYTPKAYTSEYWNNDCLSCEGDDGTPFTFTKIAENTYKIQNSEGEYLRKYSGGNHPDFESTWYNEDNFKWIISAGTNGTWRFTSKAAMDYALVKSGNYFDFQSASNVTPSSSYYDLELEPAASTVYQSNPNCASTYTITFNTHGGTFVQGNYAYATETTSGLSGTTTSKFPSATLSGCTFAGWKEGSEQDEVTSSSEGDAPILIAADANMSVSSNKTYHAVYHYYDEDWSFDPTEGGTYHMYATISGTKYFCSGTPSTSYGVLTSTTDCNDVVDVVITPGTGANVGKYKINIDGHDVSPELEGTGLKRGTFWWNIAEVDDNLYHITADGAESGRSLNCYSTSSAFTHYKDNGAGNTKDISFGRCRQHHWTSEPVLVPMVVLNSNSNIMVTSTNGQTLRSTTMLTVTATHYGETTKIYLSANVAGVGFLKSDGTALSSDAGGSYLQTDAEGELATSVYVTYAPTVTTDGIENVTITARDGHSPSPLSQTTRSAQVRHLPTRFIIAQKVGDDWYALPNDMGNNYTSSTTGVKLSAVNEATGVATIYSDVTDQFAYQLLRSKALDNAGMVFSSPAKSNNIIKANTTASTSTIGLYAQSGWNNGATPTAPYFEFTPTTSDLKDYTLKNTFQNNYLGITSGSWGIGASATVRFFTIDQQPAATITWQNDMLEAVHATNKAENGVVTLPSIAAPVSCNATLLPTFCGWKDGAIATYVTSAPTYVQAGDAATTDKTYYAVFKHATLDRWYTDCPTIYTITYTANGGTGADHLEYTMNTTADAITVGAAGFSKEGCTFVGWTNPSDDDGAIITPGAGKITGLSGDITLNAVWIGTTTVTGTVRLTASAGEMVATGTTDITISSTNFACATKLRFKYKDVTNDVTYGRSGSPLYSASEFRLCNASYNVADVTPIDISAVTGAYNQTFSITYEPKGGANTLDHYQLIVEVLLKNTVIETKTLDLYGRTLPASFAIATKIGGAWYALPNDMSASGTYDPILISVTEDASVLNWTAQGPSNTAYIMRDYTANYSKLRFAINAAEDANKYCLWAADGDAAGIRNYSATSTEANYGWIVSETNADFSGYTMATSNNTRTGLMISGDKWEMANSGYSEIHFIPLTTVEMIDIIPREWKTNGLVFAIDADDNVSLTSGHTKYGIDAAPSINVTSITRHSTGGYGLYEVGLPDLTSHYGKVLTLKMKIGGVDKNANVTIPIIVSGTTTTTTAETPFTALGTASKDYDVVILDGAKLTTNATASGAHAFHNFYVYSDGTWINDNGSTSLYYLELRGGIKGIDAKNTHVQGVPHVMLNKTVSSTTGANLDMTVYTDHGYALSVPFDVALSKVNFANSLKPGTGAQVNGTLASQFFIRKYDGEVRANNGKGGWVDITPSDNKTIHAGEGYTLQGKRPKGQPFAVIRFPFTGVGSWANSSGEVEKSAIPIYAYAGSGTTPDNDKGWNLIANPYMATIAYDTEDELTWAAAFKVGSLDETATKPWDGKYAWKDASHAYVTIPNDSYTAFPQTRASKATFYPFKNFFIQTTAADGVVTFVRTDRQEMPRYLMPQEEQSTPIYADINLAHGEESAQAGLTIDEEATAGYKFGEDQNIFENRNDLTYLKVYTVADGHYLVGNTLTPAETAEMIPLEFYAPSKEGEYIFSLDDESDSERLEYVILYDAELGISTNLLQKDYHFTVEESGIIENRFSINLTLKKESDTTTGAGTVKDTENRPTKFIYQDKMYILYHGIIYDAVGKKVSEIKK